MKKVPVSTIVFACIVLVAIIVAGVWMWDRVIDSDSPQVNLVQQDGDVQKSYDVVKGDSEGQSIPEDGNLHPRSPRIVPVSGKTTVWYEIPELGVKVELNSQFAHNLIYAAHTYRTPSSGIHGVTVYFLSKGDLLEGCDLNELSYGESGALSVLYTKDINDLHSDDFSQSADPRRSEFEGRQFRDFYMYSQKSPETCRSAMLEEVQKGIYTPKNFYQGSGAMFIDITKVVPVNAE